MGPGSLRATLRHLYGAERIWFERWQGRELPELPHSRDIVALSDLDNAWRNLATARNTVLEALPDDGLRRPIAYVTQEGQPRSTALGGILLHVVNHGVQHRAQALNMLRHLGVKPIGLDYLFMKCERPTTPITPDVQQKLTAFGFPPAAPLRPPPALDLATLRAYFRYGDWAQRRVLAVAVELSDEALNRPFEIGPGTVRRALLHIRDGEQWWYENWTRPIPGEIAKLPETTAVRELARLFDATALARNAYLDRLRDEDLLRVVGANVAPDVRLKFRLGETLLQLCVHGTHHRAQVLNMLRQLGADVPPLDYVTMLREEASE